MPRPKRTKVAASAPAVVPATSMRSTPLPIDIATPRSSSQITSNSDDSRGLVKTVRRGRLPNDAPSREAFMSGALGPDDVQDSGRTKPLRGSQRAALSRVARQADQARTKVLQDHEKDTATMKEIANLSKDPVQVFSPITQALEKNTKIRGPQPGLDVETRTVERIQPVPASVRKFKYASGANSSILASAKFTRTRRQPSILQIGRKDDTLSSSEPDDVLDDFEPDDESTPFHAPKPLSNLQHNPSHLSSSMPVLPQIFCSNPRKRKITPPEIQVPCSPSLSSGFSLSPLEHLEAPSANLNLVLSAISVKSYEDDLNLDLPAQKTNLSTPNSSWGNTIAPPQSSSLLQSSPAVRCNTSLRIKQSVARPDATTKRKQPSRTADIEQSNKSTAICREQTLQPLSTTELQKLLPRRRRKLRTLAANNSDIPSSSEANSDIPTADEDEDELSFIATNGRRTTGIFIAPSNKGQTLNATAKKRLSRPKTKARVMKKMSSKQRNKDLGPKRTYSRRDSDKENVSRAAMEFDVVGINDSLLPDDAVDQSDEGRRVAKETQGLPAKVKTEMRTLAKKFQEVDQWEMEFEEVTASSSSQLDAR